MKTTAFYIIFCLMFSPFICIAQKNDSIENTRITKTCSNEYIWNEFISNEKGKHDELRKDIITWSIAVAVGLLTFIAIFASLAPHSVLRKVKKDIDATEKHCKELLSGIEGKINQLEENKLKQFENKLKRFEERVDERMTDLLQPFEREFLSDSKSIVENGNDEQKRNVFLKLLKLYEDSQDSELVLSKLNELSNKSYDVNEMFTIYFYMGYIYNDEKLNEEKIDYVKAKECFEKCLNLDIKREQRYIYLVLNDLGFVEMQLAENLESKEAKKEKYKYSKKLLDESIVILHKQKIRWSNPYKNKGYCLGKLAMFETNYSEQVKLFMQAFAMYQIAFTENTCVDKVVEKLYETIEDFANCVGTKKTIRRSKT